MPKTNDLTQEPFTPYKLDDEKAKDKGETFTIWMSAEEMEWLNENKRLIRQPKNSTALKQLAKIGAYMLGQPSTAFVIDTLFKNDAKNERLGIHIVE